MRTAGATTAVALLAGLLVASTLLASPALAQATGTATPGSMPSTTTSTALAPTGSSTTTPSEPTGSTTTTPPAAAGSTTTTTTTLPQIGQGPVPGSPPPSTTVPPPAVTVPPETVQALFKGLQGELAQFAAMEAYRRDQIASANAATQTAAADTAVGQAEQALAAATATRDGALHSVGSNVRDLADLAIALYLHEDVATETLPDSYNGSIEDRRIMLDILLQGGQHKVTTSRQDASVAAGGVADATARLTQARAGQAVARRAQAQVAAVLAGDKAAALGLAAKPRARSGKTVALTGPNIAGPPALTADELAGWFASTGHQANATVPMAALAADYVYAGQAEGVESDVAFAQSVIETGYFAFPAGGQLVAADNNFAGIGACDSCSHGWTFPDARTGVAAQLQLLHSYASPTPVATPLVGKVFVAGCCRTWMSLTGVWATAPTYGYVVLSLYKQMVDWALPRRLATAGITATP